MSSVSDICEAKELDSSGKNCLVAVVPAGFADGSNLPPEPPASRDIPNSGEFSDRLAPIVLSREGSYCSQISSKTTKSGKAMRFQTAPSGESANSSTAEAREALDKFDYIRTNTQSTTSTTSVAKLKK